MITFDQLGNFGVKSLAARIADVVNLASTNAERQDNFSEEMALAGLLFNFLRVMPRKRSH